MTRRPRSLFWTVVGMFLLAAVGGTLVQALVAVAVLQPLEEREGRTRAELTAARIAAEIAASPQVPRGSEIDSLLARHRAVPGPPPPWLVYRGRDGAFVTHPAGRARVLARLIFSGAGVDTAGLPPGRPGGWERVEVLARREVMRGPEVIGEVVVARPVWPRGPLGFFGSGTALLFLPVTVITSIVAGLVMMRMLVGRLRALETLAARVAEGDLSVRIADTRGDEIGRLAERLDRMTERLAEARDRIETTERQRKQLFADITHELATPLTSIRGYAETLLDPRVTVSGDERTRYVRGVLDEARRLDRLTRDLFELARLEAGATTLTLEPLDWVALCRNTLERFEPRLHEAGLSPVWRGPLERAWIEADGSRIEEVLENLLVNALRYVPQGRTVELTLASVGEHGERFRLTVSDDGPGLPAAELPHVFERFYRGSGSARDNGGSGLGLAIVREIVERHGGGVRAEGRSPHGLAIVVELPAREAQGGRSSGG